MGKSRIGGLALLALLVGAYFVGQSGDSKTTSTLTGSQQPTEIYRTTATQLFDKYDANEVATDMALKGKIVEISGTVQDVTKDVWGYLRVGLRTSNQFMAASMQVVAEQEATLAGVRKGQGVTLRCKKMKRWGGTPYGDDCRIETTDGYWPPGFVVTEAPPKAQATAQQQPDPAAEAACETYNRQHHRDSSHCAGIIGWDGPWPADEKASPEAPTTTPTPSAPTTAVPRTAPPSPPAKFRISPQ